MENDEANDGNDYSVGDLNKGDINDEVIIGSISTIVGVLLIAGVIGIWCFYRKYMHEGHVMVNTVDVDDEAIEDEDKDENDMTVKTDVVEYEETERLH